MDKVLGVISAACLLIIAIVFLGVITALPVWILWNWIMHGIFGLPWLTFWQSLGLSMLCSFLFKSNNIKTKKD